MRLHPVKPIRLALPGRNRGLKLTLLLAVAVPAVVALTAISTLAASSPSPSGAPLPGDPAKGGTLFGANCATCHGASLGGAIGPALNPIAKLPGVPDSLDVAFLIDIITNGRKHQAGDPGSVDMPAKGGNTSLTDQDVKDLSYVAQRRSELALSAANLEQAKRDA